MKKNNKKGFTLAELLIVVAIIAVLVAIAIPVFTAQLEKAREATDLANIRAAYAEVVTEHLSDGEAHNAEVELKQDYNAGWVTVNPEVAGAVLKDESISSGKVAIVIDADGDVTIGGVPVPGTTVNSGTGSN